MKRVISKLKEFLPRLTNYLLILLFIILTHNLVLPLLGFLRRFILVYGYNAYDTLSISLLLFGFFIIFRIFKDISPILDIVVKAFVKILPGSDKIEEKSIKRILGDFAYIIIIILTFVLLESYISRVSEYGTSITRSFAFILIILLFYDVIKTGHILLEEQMKTLSKIKLKKKKS